MSSSSTSTDNTDNEDKAEQMKEAIKLWNIMRKKRQSKRKKNNKTPMQITSMPVTDSVVSSSKRKDFRMSLKDRLKEYLKQDKYIDVIKSKLEKSKERVKEHERCSYDLEYNEDGTKIKVKEIKDPKQDRCILPKKVNKKQDIRDLRRPVKKINKKGIDKNGNILENYPKKHNTPVSMLVQPPSILDIDHIVEKCANKFKDSIKNAIVELANSVIQPDPESDDGIPKKTIRKTRTNSTKDEILTPCSNMGSYTDKIVTQAAKSSDIQDSNNMKIYLDKETDNLYNIQNEQFKKNHLNKRKKLDNIIVKENAEENDKRSEKVLEERYRNLEMGRKMFENAYTCLDDEENAKKKKEVSKNKQPFTDTKDKVSRTRITSISTNLESSKKTEETVADSNKEKSETKEIDLFINVEMVNPIDIYLSSLRQYDEYRTDVYVPKTWIESDPDPKQAKISDGDTTSSQSSDEGISSEDSQSSTQRPVTKHSQKTKMTSDDKTSKNTKSEDTNEKSIEPKLKVIKSVITDYISSIRQEYEKENTKKEKNFQALEKETIKCQGRIDKELEFFKRLALKQQRSKSSSESSSDETGDEVFKKSKKKPKKVSGKARKKKTQKTKRSSSPVTVYHYYKPSFKAKEETTTFDFDDSCYQKVEAKNPFNLKSSRPRIGPRTPPQESSSDGEIDEISSEESKLNMDALESLHTRSDNRVPVLQQKKTQTTSIFDPRIQNTKNSNQKFTHYEPMIITKSSDARSITKPKI